MAGVKGRSGGSRANTGGARPGAGRPKKPVIPPVQIEAGTDMLALLQRIALGHIEASTIQVRAAIAAVQYTHTKKGDGGVKDGRGEKAKQAASKFAPAAPPLKLVRGA